MPGAVTMEVVGGESASEVLVLADPGETAVEFEAFVVADVDVEGLGPEAAITVLGWCPI